MCAVVRVTKGMEESLEGKWENKPSQIWNAEYTDIEVEVEEYIYDQTGNYFDRLVIGKVGRLEKHERLYAYTGERMVLFLRVRRTGKCAAYRDWSFIISDKNRLVPMTSSCCREMNEYGGKRLNTYKKDVTEIWETYTYNKNYQYAIGKSILEETGEPDMSKARWGFYPLEEKELHKDVIWLKGLFIRNLIDENEQYLDDERSGVIELKIKTDGMKCEVLEQRIVSEKNEDMYEELQSNMGEMNHMIFLDEQDQKEYEYFVVGQEKLFE